MDVKILFSQLLVHAWTAVRQERMDNAIILSFADLAVEAQQDDHEEEEAGPEGRGRQLCHGLGVGDERQTGTCRSEEKLGSDGSISFRVKIKNHVDF